ncbi:MAG TPA: hypothetical protein VMB34_31540 [Acetobacteraceae bacterium]|nr:hypothetical protein [Acetobacteraceae bacterium]
MRGLSFTLRREKVLKPAERGRLEVYDPTGIQARLNRSMRRRFTDDLGSLIHRACLTGHIDAASELLDVLRKQYERERHRFPHGRQPADRLVDDLAAEIAAAARKQAA